MRKVICTASIFAGIPALLIAVLILPALAGPWLDAHIGPPPHWIGAIFGFIFLVTAAIWAGIYVVKYWHFCSNLCDRMRNIPPQATKQD